MIHPLNGYPGPLLAKLSDSYAGYFALCRSLHLATYLNERMKKSFVYDLTRQANGTLNVFNALDEDIHRRKRRLVGHAITERAMRSFEVTMTQQINIFLHQLISSARSPIYMATYVKRLSFDVVFLLAFGYPLCH